MQKFKIFLTSVLFLAAYMGATAQIGASEFFLEPIRSQYIPVTLNKITCVVFPVGIKPAGKGTKDVLAQKVKGTDNVLELKAARQGFAPTNLTVIGLNGRLYSLELRYEADPGICNYRVVNDSVEGYEPVTGAAEHTVLLSGLPADESVLSADADTVASASSFLRLATGSEKMRLVLQSIYIKDRLMWLRVKVKNHSLLAYPVEYVHFSIQDKKRAKRTAIQERILRPVYSSPENLIPGKDMRLLVFGFRPFTIPKHKKLVLQLSEPGGGRLLTLPVGYKTVLKTRVLQ